MGFSIPFGSMLPYDEEQRSVWVVRLAVHFTGCLMIHAAPGKHPFLASNRKWMVISLLLFSLSASLQEGRKIYQSDLLNFVSSASYKVGESCVAFVVLSGCFLIHAVLQKQVYRLSSVFYLVLSLFAAALLTNNEIKLGYVANTAASAVSLSVMRDFQRAHEEPLAPDGSGGAGGGQGSTVQAIIYLEALLVVLNAVTFGLSLFYRVFGIKAAVYVLYIFRVTLVYLLVRPYLVVGVDQMPADRLALKL